MTNISTGGKSLIDIEGLLEKSGLGQDMKSADLGCGSSGHLLFACARTVGKNGVLYAVDILKNVLESIDKRAKTDNLPQIKTVWSDLEVFGAAKIESSSLDVAFLVNTLYQSQKRAEMLREAIRMLKPEGRLAVVDWKKGAAPFGPASEKRVNKEQLKIAGQKIGLRLEEEFDAGKYHFGLIFEKNQ